MTMKWKDLSGEERYRVIQLARRGEVPITELCTTFGVSRQTLHTAMEKADRAAMEALTPKSPGRKGKTEEEKELTKAKKAKTALEKDVKLWKTKYEIAMTFVELHRKLLDGEDLPGEETKTPGKKRTRKNRGKGKPSTSPGPDRRGNDLAGTPGGTGDGDETGEP
jgi:transposase-like protein